MHAIVLDVSEGSGKVNIPELEQEAESGSVVAQSILGICYLEGYDVEVNFDKAFRLLSAASNRGARRARFFLARMYTEGLSIEKNPNEALPLYEAAANAGEFLAQVEMGRIFSRGLGVSADPAVARRWRSAAASLVWQRRYFPELPRFSGRWRAAVPSFTSSEQLRQSAAVKKRGMSHRVGVQATAC